MDKYLYGETRIMMSRRSKVLGILAVASGILFFVFPLLAIILASFAILFAFLSKGYHPKYDKDAKKGMILGTIVLSIFLALGTFGVCEFVFDDEFREAFYQELDEKYEDTYGELLGVKPSELFKEILPGGDTND